LFDTHLHRRQFAQQCAALHSRKNKYYAAVVSLS
jgi:hypothetical protein